MYRTLCTNHVLCIFRNNCNIGPIKEEHFDLALAFKLDPNMQLNMTNNNNNNNNSNFNNMNTNNRATHSATPKLDIFKEAGHTLNSVTFLTPTYCDFCSELIVGVVKQGLRCESELCAVYSLSF